MFKNKLYKEDFQMNTRFVLICEKLHTTFTNQVQSHLDRGYVLKGETFITTVINPDGQPENLYNQVLVKFFR